MNKNLLILFAKKPVLGKVKTRLAKEIGREKAYEIYKTILNDTIKNIESDKYDKWIFWKSFDSNNYDTPGGFKIFEQAGKNLGEIIINALSKVNDLYDKIIIIGSDCPFVNSDLINYSFDMLENNDVVIGPAHDGGYYLLGMKQARDTFFQGIDWSTSKVFEQTVNKINELSLSYFCLEKLSDIDNCSDLRYLN